MRSESCSFIWQPKVVTWNAFTGGGYELLALRGGSEGGEISRGVASVTICVNRQPQTGGSPCSPLGSTVSSAASSSTSSGSIAERSTRRVAERPAPSALPRRLRRRPHVVRARAAGSPPCWRAAPAPLLSHRERRGALGHPSHRTRPGSTSPSPVQAGFGAPRRSWSIGRSGRRRRRSTPGIPVTTAGQTLADLATALPGRALEKAVEMAEVRKLRRQRSRRAIPARSGCGRRPAATSPLTTDSPLEDAFLALCDAHGIPRPLVQPARRGPPGRLLLARAAADRRDRRLRASRHARRLRARSGAGRSADGARLAGAALHRAAGRDRGLRRREQSLGALLAHRA